MFARSLTTSIARVLAARPVCGAPVLLSCARFQTSGGVTSATPIKSTDPTYEDDRWLEAQISQDAEMTQEERYAAEKQRELMRSLLNKVREESEAKHDEHKEEIASLKKKLAKLEKAVPKPKSGKK